VAKLAMCVALVMAVVINGCGYHQLGSATHLRANVHSIAVPIFQSRVQAYHTETAFTEAVVRELNERTKYRVLTASGDGTFNGSMGNADAILKGTILTETIAPLTFDATSGQTSSYLVTVHAVAEVIAHDGTVLYRNPGFEWREQYQSTQDLSGFVQEDGAAVRRMARDFAQGLVSDMLENFQ
jgi:outer membrane lipopolysaccharide assembly protein LptE/RlpB